MCVGVPPQQIVNMLNTVFTELDHIALKYGIEKIKTIGDCYMAAAGIPKPRNDHAEAIANFALEAIKLIDNGKLSVDKIHESEISRFEPLNLKSLNFRIGIDCGPVVAGVIGEQKFIYDLWGDTVNTASRMEDNGVAGKIQVTSRFREKLGIRNEELGIKFEERGGIEIKGKGIMRTYILSDNT